MGMVKILEALIKVYEDETDSPIQCFNEGCTNDAYVFIIQDARFYCKEHVPNDHSGYDRRVKNGWTDDEIKTMEELNEKASFPDTLTQQVLEDTVLKAWNGPYKAPAVYIWMKLTDDLKLNQCYFENILNSLKIKKKVRIFAWECVADEPHYWISNSDQYDDQVECPDCSAGVNFEGEEKNDG